jgi:hypothetical protein
VCVWEERQRERETFKESNHNLRLDRVQSESIVSRVGLQAEDQKKSCSLTVYSRGTCTPRFIAALFTIAKLWKQPRCPTTDGWIKKMWYLYTMEFYPAMKKNEILSLAGKWMKLENIILSEVSQAQKTKNRMFSLICEL